MATTPNPVRSTVRSLNKTRLGQTAASLALLAGSAATLAQNASENAPGRAPQVRETAEDTPRGELNPDAKVSIDDNNIVDLHVNDEDLANVLEMLSIQSQRNIIASKNVSARVTANLYNVTFHEALDSILNVNGYGYIEEGNFIYVYTLEEINALEKEQMVKVSKVLRLNYLNAVDAAEFVKPLLSEAGQIKTNGKTAAFPAVGDTPMGNDEYAHDAMLVVIDFEANVAEIETLVAQLDTRPTQVLVEATILQTQLTENNAFGVDFSIIADIDFSDFVGVGGPLQATNALIGGRTAPGSTGAFPTDGGGGAGSSTVGNTAGPGGLKVGVVSNDVAVFLRVLDEVTDTTILSNPKILALNRQSSRVLVGRKVGYLQTTSTDTATTQTVEFLDTGTQLYFRPFVTNEGTIRMELKPQVSEAVIRETSDSSGSTVTIPDEITNELVTNVMVRDGQTIVLGGLFRESTETVRRQVPFLGDIPLLGAAFRGNEDETQRSEIIFLITPTIVNDAQLAEAGERGEEYVEKARAGSREGVLRWSRDKMTALKNIEAERLAAEGDTERALLKTRQSLSLNPRQPEAIEMRERLGGEVRRWPGRSMLEDVIHGESGTILRRSGIEPTNSNTTFTFAAGFPAEAPKPTFTAHSGDGVGNPNQGTFGEFDAATTGVAAVNDGSVNAEAAELSTGNTADATNPNTFASFNTSPAINNATAPTFFTRGVMGGTWRFNKAWFQTNPTAATNFFGQGTTMPTPTDFDSQSTPTANAPTNDGSDFGNK